MFYFDFFFFFFHSSVTVKILIGGATKLFLIPDIMFNLKRIDLLPQILPTDSLSET